MADFQVNVVRVDAIEPIEGADRIELAVVGEFRSIVAKGAYKPGDLAVYLPEDAILPDWLIEKLNLVGKLSGAGKNRIKAIKLRGCLSQGILYPIEVEWTRDPMAELPSMIVRLHGPGDSYETCVDEGDDVAEFLGIKKYDPTEAMDSATRARFYGNCAYIPGKTVKYDLENWKKYSRLFDEGEEVVITEKLHGTMCCFAWYPGLDHEDFPNEVFIYSKGLGAKGQVFKWSEENKNNVYMRAFESLTERLKTHIIGSFNGVQEFADEAESVWSPLDRLDAVLLYETVEDSPRWDRLTTHMPMFLFGEVYGKGVQDLGYDSDEPQFRAFDLWLGTPEDGGFVDAEIKYEIFEAANIPRVPVLYKGPYNKEIMLSLTDGETTLGGGHVREGVVITPLTESKVHRFGRKVLKNVSGNYLTRKGETTEFA